MAYSFVLGAADSRRLSWAVLSDPDGDGNGEIVITAQSSASLSAGTVYVILSASLADLDARDGVIDSVIDISEMLPGDGYALDFDGLLSTAGQIHTIDAGDVDGDGTDDLLIVATGTTCLQRQADLKALDRADGIADGSVDLSEVGSTPGGYRFASSDPALEWSLMAAGNVDGTGRDDLAIARWDPVADTGTIFLVDAGDLAAFDAGDGTDGVIGIDTLDPALAGYRFAATVGGAITGIDRVSFLPVGHAGPGTGPNYVIGTGTGPNTTQFLFSGADLAALDRAKSGDGSTEDGLIDLSDVGSDGLGYVFTTNETVGGTLAAIGSIGGEAQLLVGASHSSLFIGRETSGAVFLIGADDWEALDRANSADGTTEDGEISLSGSLGYHVADSGGYMLVGAAAGHYAGLTVGGGRIDADADADLLIAGSRGRVHVILADDLVPLDEAGSGTADGVIDLADVGAAHGGYTLIGPQSERAGFGALAVLPDLDGGGGGDLLIGGLTGRSCLVYSEQLAALDAHLGTAADRVIDLPTMTASHGYVFLHPESLGRVAAVDTDGDGAADRILFGTFGNDLAGIDAGAAYRISLPPDELARIDRIDGAQDGVIELSNTPICFVRGTGIATIRGPVPVEDLRPGDRVLTMEMGYQPQVWTERTSRLAYGRMAPVRIAAGTIGNARDLLVSPQHRMLLRGAEARAFVPAIRLANGDTIRQVEGGTVEYFHVMCERHQVLFAEGAASESVFPCPQAWKTPPAKAPAELLDRLPGLAPEAAERAPGRPGPRPVPGYGRRARPVAGRGAHPGAPDPQRFVSQGGVR